MKRKPINRIPPLSREAMLNAGVDRPDFVLVSGDAYVDHPSFGPAIICRVLQDAGYHVAVLAQPDWRNKTDFCGFGEPRLAYLVTSGNLDSMVNHYTSAKRKRSEDLYSPNGRAGLRPDRACIVYANRCREAYPRVPVILGGIEASLRRFAHYDYWDDRVRHSILYDAGADLLLYGMAERAVREVADALDAGTPASGITNVNGTCYRAASADALPKDCVLLASFGEVANDKAAYARAFLAQMREQDAVRGKPLAQPHEKGLLVANPPALPLTEAEMDAVYALPYTRRAHPDYSEQIPALSEVSFSITSARGCFGSCSFCALTFHQGRVIQPRSHASILAEAKRLTHEPDFDGYIHDVGGPSANFRVPACQKQLTSGACADRTCIGYERCPNLTVTHEDYVALLGKLRALPGVKKVFVRSGVRYDYILYDRDRTFLKELAAHHVSGQLKVAPEHVSDRVLYYMNKPPHALYERFAAAYSETNHRLGLKQYLVPYLIASHPGCALSDAIELALYLKRNGIHPQQVQDFYPTPGTLATCMYHTGLDPRTMERVYCAKTTAERAMQRALMQHHMPRNYAAVRKALRLADREDLIGYGRDCLVPPERDKKPGKGGLNRRQPNKTVDKPRRNR